MQWCNPSTFPCVPPEQGGALGRIRLKFSPFSTNDFFADQVACRMSSIRKKNKFKNDICVQLSGRYAKIPSSAFPLRLDFTFLTVHTYDVDNHSVMVKFIIDSLVRRGILQDDNPKIIQEVRIKHKPVSSTIDEGCIVEFFGNWEPDFPNL